MTEEECNIQETIEARMRIYEIARETFKRGKSFYDFRDKPEVKRLVELNGLESELDHIFYMVWRPMKYYL